MLKSIGSLHNVPAPSAAVLGESLKLLATFGDKKSISALLEQVQEVQAKNEQVFREAQAAIGEIGVMQKALDASQIKFATTKILEEGEINRRIEACSQAEARLSGKAADFDAEQDAALSSLDDKQGDMLARDRTLIERESKCNEKERDLVGRLAVLEKKETAMRAKEQLLQSKENKLRALLDGG